MMHCTNHVVNCGQGVWHLHLQPPCSNCACSLTMAKIPAAIEHLSMAPIAEVFWHRASLVKSVFEFMPRMKVRHPLHAYLRLRCVCRKILQVTHAQNLIEEVCSALLTSLGNEYIFTQPRTCLGIQLHSICETQYKAMKKIKDSGFLCQTIAAGPGPLCVRADRAFLIFDKRGYPKGMTKAYYKVRIQMIGKFGWFEGRLYL